MTRHTAEALKCLHEKLIPGQLYRVDGDELSWPLTVSKQKSAPPPLLDKHDVVMYLRPSNDEECGNHSSLHICELVLYKDACFLVQTEHLIPYEPK